MADKSSIIKVVATVAAVGVVGFSGYAALQHFGGTAASGRSEKVFVQRVGAINTVSGGNLFATNFAGVIVAQETVDVKYDVSKTIEEVLVSEGDTVKKGDKLLTYNVEAIQLEIETAKLEIERLETSIESNNNEITRLEQEKKTATGDAQVSYTTQILSLQSENARSEYDIKTKKVELQKLEASLKSAYVTAPISGTVKSLKMPGSQDMYMENADVLMTIAAEGDYRVKGIFNEQNGARIRKGSKVILHSRVDDTQWGGTISEIDTNPQQDNNYMYGYGYSDDQTTSSKYAFYVKPDSLDGFMLGQHILIETGVNEEITTKQGIWLYSGFVLWDGDRNYVWAKTGRDLIEKRYVEIGSVDDNAGDCQILSGLDADDYIAYPADYIEAGLGTTTNSSDKNIPENTNIYGDGEGQGGMFVDDYMSYDGNGDMTFIDEDGKEYTFDENGNLIEGGEGYFTETTTTTTETTTGEKDGDTTETTTK